VTETITFLGQELRHIPDEEESDYGRVYKNETIEVRTPGENDGCNFSSAEVRYRGEMLSVHGYVSLAELERRIQQRMADADYSALVDNT